MSAAPKSWWPMCAKCGKPVDSVRVWHKVQAEAIRYLTLECHGETEDTIVGVWAAFEIAHNGTRLPDAFQNVAAKR